MKDEKGKEVTFALFLLLRHCSMAAKSEEDVIAMFASLDKAISDAKYTQVITIADQSASLILLSIAYVCSVLVALPTDLDALKCKIAAMVNLGNFEAAVDTIRKSFAPK